MNENNQLEKKKTIKIKTKENQDKTEQTEKSTDMMTLMQPIEKDETTRNQECQSVTPEILVPEPEMIFTPKAKLARTPPRRQSLAKTNSDSERENKEEDIVHDNKRKRCNESPDVTTGKKSKEGENFKRVIDMMMKQIGIFEKVMADTYKPKKEILDVCNNLAYYAKQIRSAEQTQWLEKATTEKKDIERLLRAENEQLRKEIKGYRQKETVQQTSIGVQVNLEHIQEEFETMNRQIKEKIKTALNEPIKFDNIKQIIDEKWPEEIFKATKVTYGKEEHTPEEDLAIFVDPDPLKNGEELEKLINRVPPIRPLIEEGLIECEMEFIRLQVEVLSSRNKDQNQYTNTTYVLPMKMDKGIEDAQKIYDLTRQLKEEALKQDRKFLKVTTAGHTSADYIRKIMEYIFRENDIQIIIEEKGKDRKDKGYKKKGQRVEREKILVKTKEGESYADLLKSVKNSVNIQEKDIEIRAIKKTNKGDLLLEVTGGKGKAVELKQTIEEKNRNAEVTIQTDEIILHITDIDASIESKELKEEIMKAEDIQDHQVRIISIRPSQNGNQTATVALKKAAAIRVINRGKIKIGWVNCRARKRIHLLRCFRCHLFGHKRENCKEKDRSNLCLKCLKPGHIAKDCQSTPICVVCDAEGHRADQTKCPEYRKLIKQKSRSTTQMNKRVQHRKISATSSALDYDN